MNKIIILPLCILLSSSFVFAAEPIGRIADIKGGGFISQNGATHEIKKGDLVYLNSEIVVEHQGQVTLADNTDHKYHLGKSTSIAILKNAIELRNGDLWFQSNNKNDLTKITTANASIDYQGGEGILTYDSNKGKSQLMVINGMMKLSNLRTPDLNLSVSEGNFSYVDNSYEEGAPRDPTPVGERTYTALIEEFRGIKPLDQNSEKVFKNNEHETNNQHHGREIASVHEPSHVVNKESEDSKLEAYKNSMLEKKPKKSHKTLKKVNNKEYAVTNKADGSYTPLAVHIYGQKTASPAASTFNRAPASMSAPEIIPQAKIEKVEKSESNLEKQPNIPSKETKKLLDDISNL